MKVGPQPHRSRRSPLAGLSLLGQAAKLAVGYSQRLKSEAAAAEAAAAFTADLTSGRLQNARLATPRDMIEASLTTETRGVYIGCSQGRPLSLSSDKHLLVIGGAGSGKTSRIALPMIVGLAQGAEPESRLVFDAKRELAWSTREAMARLDGIEPLHFAPMGESSWMGKSVTINPLSDLIARAASGRQHVDLAASKAAAFFPDRKSKGDNAWISEEAMMLSELLLVHYAELEPDKCTPAQLGDVSMMGFDELRAEITLIHENSDAGGGRARKLAGRFLSDYDDMVNDKARQSFTWIMQEFSSAFRLFARGGSLREATACTSFDVGSFKREPRALFIHLSPKYMDSHGRFIAMIFDYLMQEVAEAHGPVRCSFIIDEFAQLPRIPSMARAIRYYRDHGVRMVAFIQDRDGMNAYKNDGGFKLFSESSFKLWTAQTDATTLRDLETRAGYRAVMVRSKNTSNGAQYDQGGDGVGEQVTPVLPASEIARIGLGRALWDVGGMPCAVAELPLFNTLPFAAPYVIDQRIFPLPPFVE